MRKVSSAPQLAGKEGSMSSLSRAGSKGLSAKPGPTGNSMKRSVASCNSLASMGQDDGGSVRKSSFSGNKSSLSRNSLGRSTAGRARALAWMDTVPAAPPAPPGNTFEQIAQEAGEWMMEGAAHGIASVDCFELFGFPEDAPNLTATENSSAGEDEERAMREKNRKTAEAACLLTPATGQERDMGAQLHAAVRRAAVENEMQTQLKYAEEVRRQAAVDLLEELEIDPAALELEAFTPRRKRRKEAADLDRKTLSLLVDGRSELPLSDAEVSPRTRQALAAVYSTHEPAARNRLTVNEADEPANSIAASMDLPEEAPPGSPPPGSYFRTATVLEGGQGGQPAALASRIRKPAPAEQAAAAVAEHAQAFQQGNVRQMLLQRRQQLASQGGGGGGGPTFPALHRNDGCGSNSDVSGSARIARQQPVNGVDPAEKSPQGRDLHLAASESMSSGSPASQSPGREAGSVGDSGDGNINADESAKPGGGSDHLGEITNSPHAGGKQPASPFGRGAKFGGGGGAVSNAVPFVRRRNGGDGKEASDQPQRSRSAGRM